MSAHLSAPLLAAFGWLLFAFGTAGLIAAIAMARRERFRVIVMDLFASAISFGAAILCGLQLIRQARGL